MLEVDTRTIEGNGGTVTLYVADDGSSCAVKVRAADGTETASFGYSDRREAIARYLHTFAYADTDLPETTDADAGDLPARVAEYV